MRRPGQRAQLIGTFLVGWLCCFAAGCGAPASYLFQAASGQWQLYKASQPISSVIEDPRTPAATRELLLEVPKIKAFAVESGLSINENYDNYVALDRQYVVWFVNASHPLAFYPKTFWFPIVGSFPGLGWFDEQAGRDHAASLGRDGWDVSVRGVRAFSTGGWFSDPIVSSMFTESDNALGYLVNVILHESLHATILIADQQYYNESLASFVGDQLTLRYLDEHYGPESLELATYLERQAQWQRAESLLNQRYQELERLYASETLSIEEKLIEKQRIMRELFVRIGFDDFPTNATLIGTRLYEVGQPEFTALLEACGQDWPKFIATTASVHKSSFAASQQEDFTGIVSAMAERGCRPLPAVRRTRYSFYGH